MHRQGRAIVWLIVAVAAASGGYIWWDHSRSDADAALEETLAQPPAAPQPLPPTPAKSTPLKLQLKTNEKFPLVKTINEKIVQKTATGTITSRTSVQLFLAIHVVETQPRRTRLRVRYGRVIYDRQIAGEKLHFDSADPPRQPPIEAEAYAGLVGNGFDFFIGPDNRILDLVDFEQFVGRCVAHVPAARRREVMDHFMKISGDEGVANFIDDSIGLLPFHETAVKPGDTWQRNRSIQRPVPLRLTQRCTLQGIQNGIAEIVIQGQVSPSATYGPAGQPQGGLQLTVRDGRLYGTCKIRAKNGLPVKSKLNRTYDMIVRYPDGRQFAQTKTTTTTIEVFQQQGRPRTIGRTATARPLRSAR